MAKDTKKSLIAIVIMGVALIAIWQGAVNKSLPITGFGYLMLLLALANNLGGKFMKAWYVLSGMVILGCSFSLIFTGIHEANTLKQIVGALGVIYTIIKIIKYLPGSSNAGLQDVVSAKNSYEENQKLREGDLTKIQ